MRQTCTRTYLNPPTHVTNQHATDNQNEGRLQYVEYRIYHQIVPCDIEVKYECTDDTRDLDTEENDVYCN
jgi:hypothetical protein